ncbi:uridine-cytidine kinase-like 1 [Pelobates cultripes]|nr:uridine-cytidine kinase-like 1 [Pelobates cultripes]
MHTIIRNKDTNRDEFIFYSKRLMRLLIEHALSFLPLQPVTVETPQGTLYQGKRIHKQRITGVSILRAGETMEQALTAVCKDIRLGKILIQTNHNTGEPEVRSQPSLLLLTSEQVCIFFFYLYNAETTLGIIPHI